MRGNAMLNGWRLVAATALVFATPATALAAGGYATENVNMRVTDYPVIATIPDDARLNIHGLPSQRPRDRRRYYRQVKKGTRLA